MSRMSGAQRAGARNARDAREARPKTRKDGLQANRHTIIGLHAAAAALANPARQIRRIRVSETTAEKLDFGGRPVETVERAVLDRLVGGDSVHQGIVIEAEPLEEVMLEDLAIRIGIAERALVVVLDQVTDPHNVGAILRSAAAFGAAGLVTTRRHAPPMSPALIKTASGAVEHCPLVQVPNLARALDMLGEAGLHRIGLDERGELSLDGLAPTLRQALVLGAEGTGLRHGTRTACDAIARLPTKAGFASLNVSNAAAIGLYALSIA